MKKYDKIYVPDDNGGYTITREREYDSAPILETSASEEEDVVVLSLEELREVFNTGYDFAKNAPDNKDFEEYLTSKYIDI